MFAGDNVITKCYGFFFTDTLCPNGSHIHVTRAVYGISQCAPSNKKPSCCPFKNDCTSPVTVNVSININTACNGKQSCTNLVAQWNQLSKCHEKVSDYVTIYYTCEQEGKFIFFNSLFCILAFT